MWFLEAQTLGWMLAAAAAALILSVVLSRFGRQSLVPRLLILPDFLIILSVSWKLAAFYAGYIGISFVLTHRIGKARTQGTKRAAFIVSCVVSLCPFLYVRACAFFPSLPLIFALVGISYNMLKAIDAAFYSYYGEEEIDFLTYANYMAFFPVITAGPIFRYRDFLSTYQNPGKLSIDSVTEDVKRLIRGLFKKVVLEAALQMAFDRVLPRDNRWWISIGLIVLNYVILYLDMSGYADIAIAMGGFLGIRVPENFNRPWDAPSFTIYWRKWHITLSSWIRDHVMVLLRGKKLAKWQSGIVNFVTMFIMGLWHDFGFAGIFQGTFIGTLMAFESWLGLSRVQKHKTKKPVYVLRCILVNFLAAVGALAYTVSKDQFLGVMRQILPML